MKLSQRDPDVFELRVSSLELDAFQTAFNETLNALEDWEFRIRTGLEREEMSRMLRDLVSQRRALASTEGEA